ncbi:MAG: proline--tRNA ligase [Candidatus Diapherotrites archaeon]|nr:proline--tRNA ligase [Candidatus Diapherotrites archaeon]MDZ4256903.1 proline--tRNA ligase [archaeon]
MPKPNTPTLVGVTVKKADDLSEWYTQVVLKAGLADYSPVHGFMVYRPGSMRLWEDIQAYFNSRLKVLDVENAYFPLLIPESFFNKEKSHAEGFAPEVAWIAQEKEEAGAERLAIRPTSETIINDMFAKWIQSHRDLPLRINQWCNIVRWEIKMTKFFLRGREFLWQEGHCAYATHEEAKDEALRFLMEYQKLSHELLAVPVIAGRKTEMERFAGADETYTIEALMPDGKALQMGTSHDLGQRFAKAFGTVFSGEDEKAHLPYQNSWGISTRLLGALVMVHGDDKGLVLPPRLARQKVAIVPILFTDTREGVLKAARGLETTLSSFGAFVDDRDGYSPGWKFNEWELKGIPLRIELGPRDVAQDQCILVRRDTGEKKTVSLSQITQAVESELEAMHHALFSKAESFLHGSLITVDTMKAFEEALQQRKIIRMKFCGRPECEKALKEKTTATSRCIPLDEQPEKGVCGHCGQTAEWYTLFSKTY